MLCMCKVNLAYKYKVNAVFNTYLAINQQNNSHSTVSYKSKRLYYYNHSISCFTKPL